MADSETMDGFARHMLTKAWAGLADERKRQTPESLARHIGRVEWTLGLRDSPSPEPSGTLAAVEVLPRLGWEGLVAELLDGLGQRVAAALAAEAAEVCVTWRVEAPRAMSVSTSASRGEAGGTAAASDS